jgi:hypothetical protein
VPPPANEETSAPRIELKTAIHPQAIAGSRKRLANFIHKLAITNNCGICWLNCAV